MKTDIKLTDRYFVRKTDDLNWTLFEWITAGPESKNPGKIRESRVFYYSDLVAALEDLCRIIAGQADALTIAEYIDNLKAAEKEISISLKTSITALKLK
jgi:hypothetical protein